MWELIRCTHTLYSYCTPTHTCVPIHHTLLRYTAVYYDILRYTAIYCDTLRYSVVSMIYHLYSVVSMIYHLSCISTTISYLAAQNGQLEAIRYLVGGGANVNQGGNEMMLLEMYSYTVYTVLAHCTRTLYPLTIPTHRTHAQYSYASHSYASHPYPS
jgi:hypothetical protein